MWQRVCLSLFFLPLILSEVIILQQHQTIYDTSPTVRVKGVGFDASEQDITIELSANGEELLRKDIDFTFSKTEDGIILKLLSSRRWVDLSQRTPPVGLILKAVRFKYAGDKNLMSFPVIIANVLKTPTIQERRLIRHTTFPQLSLHGAGLIGAKKVDLYFDPPLLLEIAYEIFSSFPLVTDQVVLQLRRGYKWREVIGPLKLIGINTGGGLIKINGNDGVVVADIQTTLTQSENPVLKVSETGSSQLLHPDSTTLTVTGTGFNPHTTILQFVKGGFKYAISSITVTSITIKLTPDQYGSPLRTQNIILLSVDIGAGPVVLNASQGVHVATIIPKPNLMPVSSVPKTFRTQTSKLFIRGSGGGLGFPAVANTPKFKFNPPLLEGRDYTIRAIDQNNFELILQAGRAWAQYPTPLFLTEMNALGSDSGWFQTSQQLAEIVEDDPHLTRLDQISHSLSEMKGMMKEIKGWMKDELVSALKGERDSELLEELKRVIREENALSLKDRSGSPHEAHES